MSHARRINRVIDHIDAHLAEDLDLPSLARVANFSAWHFHRLFLAHTGETLAARVRRRRLECAASKLLLAPETSALSVAMAVGFESAEVFSRAFKAHFGITATAWRRGGHRDWMLRRWQELNRLNGGPADARPAALPELEQLLRPLPQPGHRPPRRATGAGPDPGPVVEIRSLPAVRVAYLRHQGPYGHAGIGGLWQRLAREQARWAVDAAPRERFGIGHDSPTLTAAPLCRYDACIAIAEDFQPRGDFGVQEIPAGRWACTAFRGKAEEIVQAWLDLFARWLPASNWQPDDRPAVEALGARPDFNPATGIFSCELRLPVRRLHA